MTTLDTAVSGINLQETEDVRRMSKVYRALINGHRIIVDDAVFAMDTYLRRGNYVDAAKLALYLGDRDGARGYSLIHLGNLREKGQDDKAKTLARLMLNSDYIDGSDVLDFLTDGS